MIRKTVWRHYGTNKFNVSKFRPPYDVGYMNKPRGGLWASPVNSSYGWKNWCAKNDFRTECLGTFFDFEYDGNILTIDNHKDLDQLDWKESPKLMKGFDCISFESLCKRGIDAIFLTEKGENQTRYNPYKHLYGWDCECIVIFNPEHIKLLNH